MITLQRKWRPQMSTNADKILNEALITKLELDKIIIFKAKLSDYEAGDGKYMDGNGDYITKEEAQAEVDWKNGIK